MTLVWALSGAWQWMRGLGQQHQARRALMIAGYAWMGIASFKLIASDLDRADTPLRALAFLGVGGIGMAAAILANRKRSEHPHDRAPSALTSCSCWPPAPGRTAPP